MITAAQSSLPLFLSICRVISTIVSCMSVVYCVYVCVYIQEFVQKGIPAHECGLFRALRSAPRAAHQPGLLTCNDTCDPASHGAGGAVNVVPTPACCLSAGLDGSLTMITAAQSILHPFLSLCVSLSLHLYHVVCFVSEIAIVILIQIPLI